MEEQATYIVNREDKDERVLECARTLIKVINDSGRTVLRPDIDNKCRNYFRGGYGSLDINIFGNEIEIRHGGDQEYLIVGTIMEVK